MKLDHILKAFNKTLARLDKYIEVTDREIEQREKKMAELQSDNLISRRDAQKAQEARDKIAALLGDDD